MRKASIIILSVFIAFVFLQSLPFKFSNSLETQHIFGTLAQWSGIDWFGLYGGYMIGTFELIASLLLLLPIIVAFMKKSDSPILQKVHTLGALLALGIMTGAIYFHLFTPLGIVQPHFDPATGQQIGSDAPGILFMMACGTWVCALILILTDLKKPDGLIKSLASK
jgi:uncharacterized membrane protein